MATTETAKSEKIASLDEPRSGLSHQLNIPDELDWDCFLETAIRAKNQTDAEDRNIPDLVASIDELISNAKQQQNVYEI